jgi:hypothetical protein
MRRQTPAYASDCSSQSDGDQDSRGSSLAGANAWLEDALVFMPLR